MTKREFPNKRNNVCPRCIYENIEVGKHPCNRCDYLVRKSYLNEYRKVWNKEKKEYQDVKKEAE